MPKHTEHLKAVITRFIEKNRCEPAAAFYSYRRRLNTAMKYYQDAIKRKLTLHDGISSPEIERETGLIRELIDAERERIKQLDALEESGWVPESCRELAERS